MKKYVSILLFSLILTFFSGCGQTENTPSPEESADLSSPSEEGQETWLQEGFAPPKKITTDQALWAGKYLPISHTYDAGKETYLRDAGVCGQLFWYLCHSRESESEYFLELYDTVSGESRVKSFTPEELGLKGKRGALLGMDMLDEAHYVFRWAGFEQDGEEMYRQNEDKMIYTDLAGDNRAVEYWEQYLEKGLVAQEEARELLLCQDIDWRCDREGNIYVRKPESNQNVRLFLFDQNGELLLEETRQLTTSLRTPEGEIIFPVYNRSERCYEFLLADTAGKQLVSIARTEASASDICEIYGMQGNDIYYRTQNIETNGIVKWNVVSGKRDLVFDLKESGLGNSFHILLVPRKGQTPVLYLSSYKMKEGQWKEWLMTLQEQKPTDSEAVRVSDLVYLGESSELVIACTRTASMETPAFSYEYENASAEENRARILAELTQGGGPDLLFVSLEDMYMLKEKGALLDIGELLPEAFLEELLPGALQIGTIDGALYGIPPAVFAETLVAGADVWPEDTWRLEDIIGLMEEGTLTCALRDSPFNGMGKYIEPDTGLLILLNFSLADSFLIDWENRKCHFDDERFLRLLELFSTDLSLASVNTEDWLNEGKDLVRGYFHSITNLFTFYEQIGTQNGRIIGYPTEGTGGNYLQAYGGVLVVNVNADPEKAAYFLETLFGKELQSKSIGWPWSMSVRRPVWEDYIVEESGRYLYWYSEKEMPMFADGETPFHQAKAFLESCSAAPSGYSQIRSILMEELRTMVTQNKSPKATAEAINNRVQLYLDENT